MIEYKIGYNICTSDQQGYDVYSPKWSKLTASIRRYDRMLHESLDKIIREPCSGSRTRSQFKKFRRDLQHNADLKSMIKPILEQEPALSKHFSKEELGKLSLLWIAVLGCYEKSAELLVRSGADVNELFGRHDPQVLDEKWTVLHVLLQMRPSPENERLIRLVTDAGADLQARDHAERTVLYYAVYKSRVQITEMLLEKGANVNIADDYGMTPLLTAARCDKSDELVPLLIRYGADVFARSKCGWIALHYLTDFKRRRVNDTDVARILIEKGVPFDDKVEDTGCQPIHGAASLGLKDLVKLYLKHGANVNAQMKNGDTPLHMAATSYDGRKVMKTLLRRGANVHLRGRKGRTALHVACSLKTLEDLEASRYDITKDIIRQFMFAGADILAEDRSGKTPLALILSSYKPMEQPGTWLVIKTLALKKALQPSIELKDEMIIARRKKLRDYYRNCADEIDRMKSVRFIESCTFFELFEKKRCQIAALMRNSDFENKFLLYKCDGFSIYVEELCIAVKRAKGWLEKENLINEAVYDMLPSLIVEKVVHYLSDCCNENVK